MCDVLRSFALWTSVRGPAHILRAHQAHGPMLAALWAVFVTIALAVNVTLVALLFRQYLSHVTFENMKLERDGVEVDFPAITLCNVNPVSRTRLLQCFRHGACGHSTYRIGMNDSSVNLPHETDHFSTMYQMIGPAAAQELGHRGDDFLMKEQCHVTYWTQQVQQARRRCDETNVSRLDLVPHPQFFNCYSLTFVDREVRKGVILLSLVLHLDIFMDEVEPADFRPVCERSPFCFQQNHEGLSAEESSAAGAKLVLHPPNTRPMLEKHAINLTPGVSNQVLLEEVRVKEILSQRGAPCVDKSQLPNLLLTSEYVCPEDSGSCYTAELCTELTLQRHIARQCHCLDPTFPLPGSPLQHLPLCGNLSHPDVLKYLQCKRKTSTKVQEQLSAAAECPVSCENTDYLVKLTRLKWPNSSRLISLYQNFCQREKKFKFCDKIEPLLQAEKVKEANDYLRMWMEKNFLQLEIHRPVWNARTRYVETEEYPLVILLSQAGGVCSVSLGITFVTIMEVCELIGRLLGRLLHRWDLRRTR